MSNEKKDLLKHGAFFGLIVLLANIFALICTRLGAVYIYNDARRIFAELYATNKFFPISENSFAFAIPAIISILYLVLIKDDNLDGIKRRRINLPVMYSMISASGWLSAYLEDMIIFYYIKTKYNVSILEPLFSESVFVVLKIILVFAFCYFTLENINRCVILPKVFTEGNISEIKGIIRPSIRITFIVLYLTISVFPVTYFVYHIAVIQVENGLSVNVHEIFMTAAFLFTFLGLTIRLSHLYTHPLKNLIDKAQKISRGDYRVHNSETVSSDEFGMLADSFNSMSKSLQEKDFMRDTFGKVVDPRVRDYLLEKSVNLGGEKRNVTVMFCDIRNFTSMSETMDPDKVVSLLNRYFTVLGACITKNNGIINKYIGDAIMVIFGAPVESPNHAMDAINAALEMRTSLSRLNIEFAGEQLPVLHFGIGIHSGPVLAGNIGAMNRIEYTVIGDTVNTSSRIEGLCKTYAKDILVSETTINLISNGTNQTNAFSFVADAEIRGKEERVKLYTI